MTVGGVTALAAGVYTTRSACCFPQYFCVHLCQQKDYVG